MEPCFRCETTRINPEKANLFMRTWQPTAPPKAVVAIVHGIAEHSGRYEHVAAFLADRGYATVAIDLRGHGKSEGRRAYVDAFEDYTEDVDLFIQEVRQTYGDLPVYMLGHSMGGAVATLFALSKKHDLNGMVLSGAALKVSDTISPVLQSLSGIVGRIAPKISTLKLDANGISRDPEVVQDYLADPLCYTGGTPARTGAEVIRIAKVLQQQMPSFNLPVLIMHGTDDRLVAPEGSQMLFERSISKDKTLKMYDGLYHEILNEPEKDVVLEDIGAWLDQRVC